MLYVTENNHKNHTEFQTGTSRKQTRNMNITASSLRTPNLNMDVV